MPREKKIISASPILDTPLAIIRFKAGSLGITLPSYAGGIMRGGFGMALKRVSPIAFERLFGAAGQRGKAGEGMDDGLFVPFMLIPPLDVRREFAPGETFEFELRLFGDGVAHHVACCEALALLGQLGLGKERGRYALLAAALISPDAQERKVPVWQPVEAIQPRGDASEWFRTGNASRAAQALLQLRTPLRLKHGGRLVGHAPDFAILWSRLHARASLALGKRLLAEAEKSTLEEQARAIRLVESTVRWREWTRYSARQEQTMKFGGLVGTLRYAGDLAPFVPWLKLGEALGVGGKTSFGLGCYRVTTTTAQPDENAA